jgi:hypothetical protein
MAHFFLGGHRAWNRYKDRPLRKAEFGDRLLRTGFPKTHSVEN